MLTSFSLKSSRDRRKLGPGVTWLWSGHCSQPCLADLFCPQRGPDSSHSSVGAWPTFAQSGPSVHTCGPTQQAASCLSPRTRATRKGASGEPPFPPSATHSLNQVGSLCPNPTNQQEGLGPPLPHPQEASFLKSGLGHTIPGLGHCGSPMLLSGHCSLSSCTPTSKAHIKLLGAARARWWWGQGNGGSYSPGRVLPPWPAQDLM